MLVMLAHTQPATAYNAPCDCEAEVCMSHMDPVSGTDIDLFIEGIIPCSLHLEDKRTALQGSNLHWCKVEATGPDVQAEPRPPCTPTGLPVNELE